MTAAWLTGIFSGFQSFEEIPTLVTGHDSFFIIPFKILSQAVVRMSLYNLFISFHNPFPHL
jgi:hypothetical protein